MLGKIISNILVPVSFIAYAGYLLYARYHPSVAERRYKKYKNSPNSLELTRKIFSTGFLILVLTLAVSFAFDLVMAVVEMTGGSIAPSVKLAVFIVNMILGIVGLYYAYRVFIRK